ncbi:hypothetical protein ACFCXP_37690 [Streptomyces niveus]|uniref:hypothetical protein n=1 Tax=Streptomyces niveus TaxID=193462 RepID=UPI0035DAA718
MAEPQRMGPPPDDDDDDEPEVTRASVERERRRREELERQVARESMTRRSWYTSVAATDAFGKAVEDIHHETRTPKHEVVAALMQAAVDQAPRVAKRLARQSGHGSHLSHE